MSIYGALQYSSSGGVSQMPVHHLTVKYCSAESSPLFPLQLASTPLITAVQHTEIVALPS